MVLTLLFFTFIKRIFPPFARLLKAPLFRFASTNSFFALYNVVPAGMPKLSCTFQQCNHCSLRLKGTFNGNSIVHSLRF